MKEACYKRSDKAMFASVGSDIVALHLENGFCFGMVNVGAAVWDLLEEPATLGQITERLVQEYDVEPETCRAEVAQFLDELQNEGLVEASPGPGALV